MEVSRISPACRRAPSAAQATASSPQGSRPPRTQTSQPAPARLASMASTTACAPRASASVVRRPGSRTAAVFTVTLSAPASTTARASERSRIPPPAVSGMDNSRAARRIVFTKVGRLSLVAAMSSTTTSSAPSRSYRAASSTGSPASRRSANRTPLTTRAPSVSRHGIMRRARLNAPSPGSCATPHCRPPPTSRDETGRRTARHARRPP